MKTSENNYFWLWSAKENIRENLWMYMGKRNSGFYQKIVICAKRGGITFFFEKLFQVIFYAQPYIFFQSFYSTPHPLLQKYTPTLSTYKIQYTLPFTLVHSFFCPRVKNWQHKSLKSLWNYLSNHIWHAFISIFSRSS